MIKMKRRFERLTKKMWLLAPLLLSCSCGEESSIPEAANEVGGVPLELSVSMAHSGFSSDSEVIPMRTRAEDYVVTRLLFSTLYILKEVGKEQWVIMGHEPLIVIPSTQSLKKGESLTLKKANYVLLPGTYRFLLFVNASIDSDIPLEEILVDGCKGTNTSTPRSNFYFAESKITLKKNEELDDDSKQPTVTLNLKRYSALLRYILVGSMDEWKLYDSPTIDFSITGNGDLCTGMNILGRNNIGILEKPIESKADINMVIPYKVAGEDWFFSSIGTNTLVSLFADDTERYIDINITQIGNKSEIPFKGDYQIKNVPIQRNHITTILIRRTGVNMIEHKINPDISSWDPTYPPFNYIELNNK